MALTTITNPMVAVNAIQGTLIADNAITAVHIATNAVSGTLIADNAITAVHIAQNTITVTQLADDAVEADKIADGVITTNHLNKTMISSQTEVTAVAGDFLLIGDTSDSNNLKKIPISGITNLVSSGAALDDITTGDAESTLATSTGSIILDSPSAIKLDADGGEVQFKDGGTEIGAISMGSQNMNIESKVADKDIVFKGIDGSSDVTALTLNMSEGGAAYFNNWVRVTDGNYFSAGDGNDLQMYHIADSINVIRGAPGLVLQTDDTSYGIQMGTYSGGETMFKAVKNGAVSLYYDNLDKLHTTDKGILVNSDGSKDVTIGMSNGDQDWHIGIDESAGDYFRIGRHSGMGNNSVYHVTPGYKHEWQGAHQGDSVGHFRFSNQNQGDATNTNCSLAVINGASFVQFMAWATLGARIGTRTGGWNSTGNQVTYLVSADSTFAYGSGTNFYLGSGTAITSDERLKKNIVATPTGQLAKINALRPVSFDWKDTRKDSGEGFIAQEVEKIIPEAVAESTFAPDPDDDTRDFEGDVKSIRDGVLLSRLVKAVQELSAELDAAKARITTLEG